MRKFTAAIALLASLQLSAHAKITEARVMVVKGSVTATDPATAAEMKPVRDSEIQVGSTIGTAGKSSVLMEPNPGSAVLVLEKSNVRLSEDDLKQKGETIIGRKTVLTMSNGKVQAALAHPQGSSIDFKVRTPECVAAARGTVFQVYSANGSTIATCAQASLFITWKGAPNGGITVPAGYALTVNADGTYSGPYPASQIDLDSLKTFATDVANDYYSGGKDSAPGYEATAGPAGPDTPASDPGSTSSPGSTITPDESHAKTQ